MPSAVDRPFRFDLAVLPIIVGGGFIAAIVEAARSPDPAMVIQAWTFTACMLGIASSTSSTMAARAGGGDCRLSQQRRQGGRRRLDDLGHRRHAGRPDHRAPAFLSEPVLFPRLAVGRISAVCARCIPRR
ncbi:MAG: hypothetical protein WDM81_08165 [Rhizomicrobium sp.]